MQTGRPKNLLDYCGETKRVGERYLAGQSLVDGDSLCGACVDEGIPKFLSLLCNG